MFAPKRMHERLDSTDPGQSPAVRVQKALARGHQRLRSDANVVEAVAEEEGQLVDLAVVNKVVVVFPEEEEHEQGLVDQGKNCHVV